MKKLTTIIICLMVSVLSYSQCKEYQFRKPTLSSGTYKFASVTSGVDAYITQTGSNNASINLIDDSTVYPQAWQPFIKFTNTTTSASDSSYVEFLIEFKKGSNLDTQSCLDMTAVDCDGTTNYREMIKSSLPVSGRSTLTSSVTYYRDTNWFSVFSGNTTYATIDTSNQDALAEFNYTNVQKYKLRVGAVGIVSANQVRQFSFYFKHFDSVLISLPLKEIKKREFEKQIEEGEVVFYNSYGSIIFEGTLKNFMSLIAEPNTLYFTRSNSGQVVKYMKN